MSATTDAATGRLDVAAATRDLRETVLGEACFYHERPILIAESFRRTEAQPRILRTACATAHLFANMPVRIRPGEILLGWHPSSHPDEVTQRAIDEANEYLGADSYWVNASEGHMSPDYETALRDGLGALRKRIDDLCAALDPLDDATPDKRIFYEAAAISLDALTALIRRYADLARSMAEDASDDSWRAELLESAAVCDRIATDPPRTFREALQLTWFVWIAVALEASGGHHCFGPGRMDQYLYPFYRRDREAGDLDDAHCEALLDQFFIKCNEFEGFGMSAVIMVLGGRRPDGSDATNDLSFALLDASDRVRMYFPGLDISWHADLDPVFMTRAVALLRNGNGQPSFFNSDAIVRGLVRRGVPFGHAVDHLPSTCTETSIMGRCNPWVAWPYVNISMALLFALYGGSPPGHPASAMDGRPQTPVPHTYADLKSAFMAHLAHDARQAAAGGRQCQAQAAEFRPFPLLSCFLQDCLGRGTDISLGGALYNFLQPEAVGMSNVVDGLAAVKVLVEDEGRYTLDDFRDALAADFAGHDDLLRALGDCPKYGNDDAWINALFAECAGAWCSTLEAETNYYGGQVLPGFLGWVVWIDFGRGTPATPDGRRAGAPLANSLAPCTGVAVRGVPAMVLSATEFDQSRGLGGIAYNVRFSLAALAADEGPDRLRGLIEAAFDLGLYQMQINVVSSDVLRRAQASPDQFRDLFVRIGGYLVPFVLLPEDAQADVIARTELEL
jgi:formate C-acetyltransferase